MGKTLTTIKGAHEAQKASGRRVAIGDR